MYSLYRAWLMRDALTAASWTMPPDLIITVGDLSAELREESQGFGYQFVAHKHLVSMHSGYLKSLIQNETHGCGMSAITNISLPNISSESFAPLLSFMYTGYLDLTNENIYSVLLATHLLHMPRALDLCRAFLVQTQADVRPGSDSQTVNPVCQPNPVPVQTHRNIIKPIPSRKIQNFHQSIWSPVNLPRLMIHTRPDGAFRCVSPSEKHNGEPSDPSKVSKLKSPPAIPSTSKSNDQTSESQNPSPNFSNASFDERTVHLTVKSPQRKVQKRKENSNARNKKVNNENLKVEYDVACCDGPIRFHRVLNESYGLSLDEIIEGGSGGGNDDDNNNNNNEENDKPDSAHEREYLENYPKTQFLKLKSPNFSNFMHQQMLNSNLVRKPKTAKGVIQMRKIVEKEVPARDKSQPDENKDEDESDDGKADNPERAFTCVYCKHTFKSQYCYQKHAKRHINSVQSEEVTGKNVITLRQVTTVSNTTTDAAAAAVAAAAAAPTTTAATIPPTTTATATTAKAAQKEAAAPVRREVRLLDMNVQYYPCKTCGSKFPSYYFVHKHRKMCHANEDNFDEAGMQQMDNSDSSLSEKISPQATAQTH